MATDTLTKTNTKQKLKEPSKFNVIILNDDKTTMEFVVSMLTTIFKHNDKTASEITANIHNTGSGIAGTYTYEIAEQKGIDATNMAREHNFPLVIKVSAV